MKKKNIHVKSNCFTEVDSGDRTVIIEKEEFDVFVVIDATSSSSEPSVVAEEAKTALVEILDKISTPYINYLESKFLKWHELMVKKKAVCQFCFAGFVYSEKMRLQLAFNVGDVRVYGVAEKIEPITRDDSVVAEMIREGKLTEERALFHADKSSVTQVVGGKNTPKVNFYTFHDGYKKLIVTSDGIHGELLTKHLNFIYKDTNTDKEFVENLYEYAASETNSDDRSIIMVEL